MTFAAPLFLVGLLAGLIPVILHMINRQQAKTMRFSTLRFLTVSVQRTRRRKYLHDVLLLLLRVAALALIAVGLARPTLSQFGNLLGGGSQADVVILLDNSASMATSDADHSRWDLAAGAAETLMDQLAAGDSVALLLACGPRAAEEERLQQNHEGVRQALDAARPGYERANLSAGLQTAQRLLDNSLAANQEIYVVTDMQAASWESLADLAGAAEAETEAAPIVLVDVHRDAPPNIALRRVQLHSAGPLVGVPMQATVELRGDAAVPQQAHVELLLDGKPVEVSPTLSLAAGSRLEHAFQFQVDTPGIHAGEIRLVGEDACTMDNRLFFAVSADPDIPVAVVHGARHEIDYLSDTYYLDRALTPVADGSWAIRSTSVNVAELPRISLSNYRVVFCVNLAPLEPAATDRLAEYVRQGGHIVWIAGDNVDPVRYTAMNDAADRQLLPSRLIARRESPDGWPIGWLDADYEPLMPFHEPASLYRSVLVYRHLQLAPLEGTDVRVLARLEDGEPLFVQRQVGPGSVLLLGVSAHVDWSNLPLQPIFLPLVSRLVFHLADTRAAQPELIAGRPLPVPLAGYDQASVEIKRPDGEMVRAQGRGEQNPFRYGETHDVGVYEVQVREVARGQRSAVAVNPDRDEMDPARLSVEALRAKLGERTLVVCRDSEDLPATIDKLRQGTSLLSLFLIGVLIALIAETYVANRRIAQERPPQLRRPEPSTLHRRRLPETLGDIVVVRR